MSINRRLSTKTSVHGHGRELAIETRRLDHQPGFAFLIGAEGRPSDLDLYLEPHQVRMLADAMLATLQDADLEDQEEAAKAVALAAGVHPDELRYIDLHDRSTWPPQAKEMDAEQKAAAAASHYERETNR